jgi:hypothetical protein
MVQNITKQYLIAPPLYMIALLLAFVYSPFSVAMCFVLVLFFAFTGAISRMLPCKICEIEPPKR